MSGDRETGGAIDRHPEPGCFRAQQFGARSDPDPAQIEPVRVPARPDRRVGMNAPLRVPVTCLQEQAPTPCVEIGHEETASPLNPLGIKGAGEAGAIPVGPLFAQAVEDAIGREGFEILEIPVTPSRLWEMLRAPAGATQ